MLLVIAISLAIGKGFWQIYIAIGCSIWVEVARLVRGKIKSEKEKAQAVVYEVSAELYKQDPAAAAADAAGAAGAGGAAGAQPGGEEASSDQGKDDNVVDAEFSEVKK